MPAEYAGLKGKRVAVVCVSEDSSYGTGSESLLLAREVEPLLSEAVAEINRWVGVDEIEMASEEPSAEGSGLRDEGGED